MRHGDATTTPVDRSATASGLTISLGEVTTTPWFTHLAMRFPNSNIPWQQAAAYLVQGSELPAGFKAERDSILIWSDQTTRTFSLDGNLPDHPGKWTLIIEALKGEDTGGKPLVLNGPWVFPFNVP